MTIQDAVNLILHDDQVVIASNEGTILWRGRAAEYRGEISEEEYHFDYITALSLIQVGLVVYPVVH